MFEKLIHEFSKLEDIKAIVLGGSRATKNNDVHSDYDVYVYTTKVIDEETRKSIIDPYVSYMEYSNQFWELEDDGRLKNGVDIEFIYREINNIEASLFNTISGNVSLGYSTCFLDNFMNSNILYEENHVITNIRKNLKEKDWTLMFDTIIVENMKVVRDYMPSLYYQIEKAVKRNDIVSINHRITEYFAVVFDVLFALNKTLHPGEKRLLQLSESLELKPDNFSHLVSDILENAFSNPKKLLDTINILTDNLYLLVKRQGYKISSKSYEL